MNARGVAGGEMSPMRGLSGTWAEGTGKWEVGVQTRALPRHKQPPKSRSFWRMSLAVLAGG